MAEIVRCDVCGKEARHPYRGIADEDRKAVGDDFYGFVYLRVEASADRDHGDFCSWLCLASWASKKAMQPAVSDV